MPGAAQAPQRSREGVSKARNTVKGEVQAARGQRVSVLGGDSRRSAHHRRPDPRGIDSTKTVPSRPNPHLPRMCFFFFFSGRVATYRIKMTSFLSGEDPHFKRTAVLVRRGHLGMCTLGGEENKLITKAEETVGAHLLSRKELQRLRKGPTQIPLCPAGKSTTCTLTSTTAS